MWYVDGPEDLGERNYTVPLQRRRQGDAEVILKLHQRGLECHIFKQKEFGKWFGLLTCVILAEDSGERMKESPPPL